MEGDNISGEVARKNFRSGTSGCLSQAGRQHTEDRDEGSGRDQTEGSRERGCKEKGRRATQGGTGSARKGGQSQEDRLETVCAGPQRGAKGTQGRGTKEGTGPEDHLPPDHSETARSTLEVGKCRGQGRTRTQTFLSHLRPAKDISRHTS